MKFKSLLGLSLFLFGFLFIYLLSPSWPVSAQIDSTTLDNLKSLADKHQIDLSSEKKEEIKKQCLAIIKGEITTLQSEFNAKYKDYKPLLNYIKNSLSFINKDLRSMREDTSEINLSQVELLKLENKLNNYQSTLEDVLSLGANCQNYPEYFAASQEEIRAWKEGWQEQIFKDISDFIDGDLKDTLEEIQQRLHRLEN